MTKLWKDAKKLKGTFNIDGIISFKLSQLFSVELILHVCYFQFAGIFNHSFLPPKIRGEGGFLFLKFRQRGGHEKIAQK